MTRFQCRLEATPVDARRRRDKRDKCFVSKASVVWARACGSKTGCAARASDPARDA